MFIGIFESHDEAIPNSSIKLTISIVLNTSYCIHSNYTYNLQYLPIVHPYSTSPIVQPQQ